MLSFGLLASCSEPNGPGVRCLTWLGSCHSFGFYMRLVKSFSIPGNKVFQGSNVVHLRRFLAGRAFRQHLNSLEVGLVVLALPADFGRPLGLDFLSREWKLTALQDALDAHGAIISATGISFSTLGAALRFLDGHVDEEMLLRLRDVAHRANQARHCFLPATHGDVAGFEVGFPASVLTAEAPGFSSSPRLAAGPPPAGELKDQGMTAELSALAVA